MSISNYLEKKLLDHSLGVASYTFPSTVYLAIYTSDPTDAGSGTEVSGSGYARQAITFDAATSGTGATANSSAETFTASGGNFGTITHFGIYDALTTGNLLWHGALTVSRSISDGESITFAIGDIDITLD